MRKTTIKFHSQYNVDTIFMFSLGDVGGQIGLMVGAGAMSYFEFLDCFILIIYTWFFRSIKGNKKIDK